MTDEDNDFFNEDDYEFVDEEENQEEESPEAEVEEEEEKPKKKAKSRKGKAKKAKQVAEDKADTDEPAEQEPAEEGDSDEVAEPEEEEEDIPPDDEQAVAALRNIEVRLDVNDKGNVWRVIYDDRNGTDDALVLLGGLPGLKEVWLLGTKVSKEAAEGLKTNRPKLTVYH